MSSEQKNKRTIGKNFKGLIRKENKIMEHKKSIMLKNGYQKRKGEKEYMG
jgi:hypothetical protein